MSKLIVIGHAGMRVDVPAESVPKLGTETVAPALRFELDGRSVPAAIHAARLGVSTAFVGAVGDDLIGAEVRRQLSSESIDVSRFQAHESEVSPLLLRCTGADGEVGCARQPGSEASFVLPERAERIPCRIAHFGEPQCFSKAWPHSLTESARHLKANGATITLDASARATSREEIVGLQRDHRLMLEHVDTFIASERVARVISGRTKLEAVFQFFHQVGVRVVVLRHGTEEGGAGAHVSWSGGLQEVGGAKVPAKDHTGGGGGFVGGFLAGLAADLDPLQSTRLGCMVSALCVSQQGILAGTADRELLDRNVAMLGIELPKRVLKRRQVTA